MRFSEVIGQRELKRHLVRGVDAGRVSHAQLFTGRPGAGALPLALAYVQYLNCTNRRDGDSCGECPNCRQIAGLAHPDLHFVFPVHKGAHHHPTNQRRKIKLSRLRLSDNLAESLQRTR